MNETVEISSHDYWFKVIEMLQQNWALIDALNTGGCIAHFVHDGSEVFDELIFPDRASAEVALRRNGFERLDNDPEAQKFLAPPRPPFTRTKSANGAIYSSGKFWC